MTAPLNVLHVTFHPSRHGGGVAAFLTNLTQALLTFNVQSTVAGIEDDRLHTDWAQQTTIPLITAPPRGPRSLGYAPDIARPLDQATAAADLVHVHGLRTLLNRMAIQLARKHRKPIVISPHGQLDPWLLNQRRWRKIITDRLWVRDNLHAANLLHAVSPREAAQIRSSLPDIPIAVAPPGIDPTSYQIPKTTARQTLASHYPQLRDRKLLLFMGALMPRKGPHVLAQAWSRLHADFPHWQLVIAGPGVADFEVQVRRLAPTTGHPPPTTFLGEVPQSLKPSLLAAADLFVLPSFSEAFAIAVAEALAAACPVITTHAAPWQDLDTQHCGWWIPTGLDPLIQTLPQALTLPDPRRQQMGARGQAFIAAWCHGQNTARQLAQVYRHLARHTAAPPHLFPPDVPLPTSFTP